MLTQEFPQHPFGWKTLGVVLMKEGRIDESIVACQKSVHPAPGDTEVKNLGNALRELGRLEEAVVSYTQAIALKPDSVLAHYNLGLALQNWGRLDEAKFYYNQAIVLQPAFAFRSL